MLEIVVAYCNGATPETIAAAHDHTERIIRDTLQQVGVVLRDQAYSSAEIRAQVRALHAQGMSMREIARRYGVAHTTISRLLRDAT
ncbi:MAG TPA: helix-turn-helix domain-containing protein [Terrimesophilobacter sp.]|nr:helix-turn-helix domain-containing protein [Terrimesophilobacter sp.]